MSDFPTEPGFDVGLEVSREQARARLFDSPPRVIRVGRFAVLQQLGAGAMGIVLAAYDDTLDRRVAIKLMRPGAAGGEQGRSRAVREAQALARLNHPNVVQIYEAGLHQDSLYIAMEFIAGKTLREWVDDDERRPPWQEILSLYVAAGRGLAAAHEAGIIHRDFKPDNAMVGHDGRVRVTDFGVARGEAAQASLELDSATCDQADDA